MLWSSRVVETSFGYAYGTNETTMNMRTLLNRFCLCILYAFFACGAISLHVGCSAVERTETIALVESPVIYGSDDRNVSIYGVDPAWNPALDASVAIVEKGRINDSDPNKIVFLGPTLGERFNLCNDEVLASMPTVAGCSGTIISENLVLTAGHCVDSSDCSNLRIVLNYELNSSDNLRVLTTEDVFSCKEVLTHRNAGTLDYAIVRVDRPIVGINPAVLRLSDDSVKKDAKVTAIGYPSGSPKVLSLGARVFEPRAATKDFFTANIDSFSGSSGSGVYDESSKELIGILVRGPAGAGYVRRANEICFRAEFVGEDYSTLIESTYLSRAIEDFCSEHIDVDICRCGDGSCDVSARESSSSCAEDCGSHCGDGACNGDETNTSCYEDCGVCGNGVCESYEVNRLSCCQDCGCPTGFSCDLGGCVPRIGNVNGDEVVDNRDLLALEANLSGDYSGPFQLRQADVDCDGSIDDADVVEFTAFLSGSKADLPCTAVTSLALGLRHSCALVSGKVRCWGDNSFGQLGTGRVPPSGASAADAQRLNYDREIRQIAAGSNHTCAVDDLGQALCWGSNQMGQLGRSRKDVSERLLRLELGGEVRQLATGDAHTCALLKDGTVKCWGDNRFGQLGYPWVKLGTAQDAQVLDLPGHVLEVSAGASHSCAVLIDGQLRCWGANTFGQLGLGHRRNIGDDEALNSQPAIDIGGFVHHVRSRWMHNCATLDGGQVRCWGENMFGQLGYSSRFPIGDDEKPSSMHPVVVGDGLIELVLGQSRTCGLYRNGFVRCWGMNSSGQLGYGNTLPILPNQSPGSLDGILLGGTARGIFSGDNHACSIRSDGSVVCWGSNQSGQLGLQGRVTIGDNETPKSAGAIPLERDVDLGWKFTNSRALEAWLMDESSDSKSACTALYVSNAGTEPISGFNVFYSFSTAEYSGVGLGLQDHYSPWSVLKMHSEQNRDLWTLEYNFTGLTLFPLAETSWGNHGGEKLRIHYSDWASSWDSNNDYSASGRLPPNEWYKTTRVQIVDADGTVIYGWVRPTGQ